MPVLKKDMSNRFWKFKPSISRSVPTYRMAIRNPGLYQTHLYIEPECRAFSRNPATPAENQGDLFRNIVPEHTASKKHAAPPFKTYLSRTPGEYLNAYRLKKSLADLVGTDKTVSEIASRSGINSASYYSELFRKSFGCSPREYARQNRRRDGDGEIHIGRK